MTRLGDNTVECILEIEERVKADLDKLLETNTTVSFYTDEEDGRALSLEGYQDLADIADLDQIDFTAFSSDASQLEVDTVLDETIVSNESVTDQTFRLIARCIDSVMTEEERIVFKDESISEQLGFIESLNTEQFGKIQNYLQSMPQLKQYIDFECISCKHENKITLQGFNDFF